MTPRNEVSSISFLSVILTVAIFLTHQEFQIMSLKHYMSRENEVLSVNSSPRLADSSRLCYSLLFQIKYTNKTKRSKKKNKTKKHLKQ